MKLLKPVLVIILLLCAVLAGLLAYLHFADLNSHRSRIEAAGTEAFGRQFRVGGDIDLDLWPELRLAVNDLHLANAVWGSEPEMARLGHFSLRIDPLSLFRGPVCVLDLRLADIDILLETNAEGENNWALSGAQPASGEDVHPPGGRAPEIWLQHASVERVRVRERGTDGEREVAVTALMLETNPQGEIELTGQGDVLELPLVIAGRAGPKLAFEQTGALDFELTLDLGETRLVLDGERSGTESGGPGSLDSRFEVSGLQALLDHLAVPLTIAGETALHLELREDAEGLKGNLDGRLGDVTLAAQLSGDDRQLEIEGSLATLQRLASIVGLQGLPDEALEFSTSLGFGDSLFLRKLEVSAGDTRLSASGNIGGGQSASTLQVEVRGQQAAAWLAALPEQPFTLTAQLDQSAKELQADPLQLELGESDLQGSVRVDLVEPLAVTLDLQSRRLDLLQLTGTESPTPKTPDPETTSPPIPTAAEPEASAGKKSSGSSQKKSGYVFSEDPLPFKALQGQAIDARWAIDELVTPVLNLESVDLVASLHQGRLIADTTFSGALGGVGQNHLELASNGEGATLVVNNRLRELRINLASGEMSQASEIPPLGLTLDLTAAGASARAMAESSKGNILLTLGPGLVTSGLMERFSGDILAQLVTALNPFAKTQTHMELQCGVVSVDIDSGVAEIKPLLVQTDKIQVLAGGSVDLNTEDLNIEFNTRPRSGVGVSADMFVTPFVSLEGTLAKPGVGLNETSTLLTAGAAMATGGMSILWRGMLDRATGAIDHCKTTLQEYQHAAIEPGVAPQD